MTGVEWILLLIGTVLMIGSFFVAERLSPSELNKIADFSGEELNRMMEYQIANASPKIEAAIGEQAEASVAHAERVLGKMTNEKIMAISEYSDTVLENINKTHNEVMFLYSMLNDKHKEMTGMAADLQRLAADIRNLEENHASQIPAAEEKPAPVITQNETPAGKEYINKKVLEMYQNGMQDIEIAQSLGMGVGEVRLIIGLYRGE